MEIVLDTFSPSLKQVELWAYDTNMYFIEQDEDLALHDLHYVHKLLELSSNAICPKTDYCFSILTHYCAILLGQRDFEEVFKVVYILANIDFQLNERTDKWRTSFLLIADILQHPRKISVEESDMIGWHIIVGEFSTRDFSKAQISGSSVTEYRASTASYKEFLYVNAETSNWYLSKHVQLEEPDSV